jgi:hypothetical protein
MTDSNTPVKVFRKPTDLRSRVKVLDLPENRTPIAKAEKALADQAAEFSGWIDGLVEELRLESKKVERGELAPLSNTPLFRSAFNIHGQAATIGYSSIGRVAKMLCDYLEPLPSLTPDAMAVTYQCVETISAMIRERVYKLDHPLASALVDALTTFIKKKS